eukprot:m.440747 g.440747  ORF g.440747 m.440747 type:complete len:74 (+) comp18557_c0_seq1:207-428(+)
MQEGRAGRDTVLAVFPDANVIMRRVSTYPILVTVFKVEDGEEKEVYSGDQRGFFSKNRHRDAPKLKQALAALA